jgi:hypothetical protein
MLPTREQSDIIEKLVDAVYVLGQSDVTKDIMLTDLVLAANEMKGTFTPEHRELAKAWTAYDMSVFKAIPNLDDSEIEIFNFLSGVDILLTIMDFDEFLGAFEILTDLAPELSTFADHWNAEIGMFLHGEYAL